jgi:phosphomevalonate kinase
MPSLRLARAPGKLVLSGAYTVLEGAPAVVAAVDRYASADPARPAERLTEELHAAMVLGVLDKAPWFDASPLRATAPGHASRKLGLGSSAAILVASIAARGAWRRWERGDGPPWWDETALLTGALAAHRAAQGGGSGLDVAASVLGGVLRCSLDLDAPAPLHPGPRLEASSHALPPDILIAVLASEAESRTSSMLAAVRAFAARDPPGYRALLSEAAAGAFAATSATSAADFAAALDRQVEALTALGDRAGAPIVTPTLRQLRPDAAAEGAALAPSGAGGGDVAIFVGSRPPSAAFLTRAHAAGLTLEPMTIGARGVHLAEADI